MIADQVQWTKKANQAELSARVLFETIDPGEKRIWFRIPEAFASPERFGDTLLAGLLIPAMSLGERLQIEMPLSRKVLRVAREELTPTFRGWGWDPDRVSIECETADWDMPENRGRFAFFSGGVDSWYTALKHRTSLDALVFVRGVDILIRNAFRWPSAWFHTRESAEMLGLPIHLIETNLHDIAMFEMSKRLEQRGVFLESFSTDRYSGTMMVAFALLLQKSFEEAVVASSVPFSVRQPMGSHWEIEPSWSSDAMRFELDGGEATRVDRIRAIGDQRPEAVSRLPSAFSRGGTT